MLERLTDEDRRAAWRRGWAQLESGDHVAVAPVRENLRHLYPRRRPAIRGGQMLGARELCRQARRDDDESLAFVNAREGNRIRGHRRVDVERNVVGVEE